MNVVCNSEYLFLDTVSQKLNFLSTPVHLTSLFASLRPIDRVSHCSVSDLRVVQLSPRCDVSCITVVYGCISLHPAI
ncbi:hypothetical protein OUZ56_030681 [Daphnia magna]|uniref:Uncharacterized protein n=1 Tax=Daphnia magna TaxID=35525 RepID=A0ABQ9ZS06_9CRUS|nr:hypothetical protein OUZ56_030681 [Daphnia magna]